MEFTVLSWNLFHGRDYPPDPKLRTWRSRLLRFEERNETHVQVNRDLSEEFATVLSGAEWDLAMLQECRRASPSRWPTPAGRRGTGPSPRATRWAACGACWRGRTPT